MADHQAVDLLGQWFDPLLESITLVCKRKVGTVIAAGASNAPGDRSIVGYAQDQPALAPH
jgi:hypothetical protein